jgi:hypothetical protein
MSTITFGAQVVKIGSWSLINLPKSVSLKLPSRGMVLLEGTINGYGFRAPVEPDGRGSHWLNIDETISKATGAQIGDKVKLTIEPSKNWPEPELPADWKAALAADSQGTALWQRITPMARWDWLRWIASTGRADTRERHIEAALSKLKDGERRPCCFNRAICTVAAVSKNGQLLEPTPAKGA